MSGWRMRRPERRETVSDGVEVVSKSPTRLMVSPVSGCGGERSEGSSGEQNQHPSTEANAQPKRHSPASTGVSIQSSHSMTERLPVKVDEVTLRVCIRCERHRQRQLLSVC